MTSIMIKTAFVVSAVMMPGCFFIAHHEQQEQDIRYILKNVSTENSFVAPKYFKEKPVAQLINMPVYSELDTSFVLKEDTRIQIYATGETSVDIDVNPQYFFRGDDMEFFFDLNNDKSEACMNQGDNFMYIFSWVDGKVKSDTISFRKQGAEYHGYYDGKLKDYVAEIAFPWKYFNKEKVSKGYSFGFDLAIGDNDDGIKQKAKIAWHSTSDELTTNTRNYGNILLIKDTIASPENDTMVSAFKKPLVDGIVEPLWSELPSYQISHFIMGWVRNEEDLCANVKTCWDDNNLYFLVRVHDPGKKQVRYDRIRHLQTFHDYGWIEDSLGNKVWEMHVLDSKHAGGAIKNQRIDAVLHLKAGKYSLKYITDESHSWNNWDDKPPNTPFYGIVLYKAK